jgi:acetylornithine deacetylase/succinyl-diaminopimelate desuccinylase-like protein
LEVQFGFPPPATTAKMQAAVQRAMNKVSRKASVVMRSGPALVSVEPFNNHGNVITKGICRTVARLRKGDGCVEARAVSGYAPLVHVLRRDGSLADVSLYGPGGGGNPHGRDEYYNLGDFIPVAQNIVSVILDWYGDRMQKDAKSL